MHDLVEVDGEGQPSTDGSSANGGSAATSGGTTSLGGDSGSGASAGAMATGGTLPADMIDDFEDGNAILMEVEGRRGRWLAINGGTGFTSVDGPIVPLELEAPRGDSLWGIHISGHSYDAAAEFGASFGVDLNNQELDGSAAVYDLTGYDGLLIWAKGSGQFVCQLRMVGTNPIVDGGSCDPGAGESCYGHYWKVINVSEEWAPIVVPFSQLKQPDWAKPVPLELDQVQSIYFQNDPVDSPFDVWIDEISLY